MTRSFLRIVLVMLAFSCAGKPQPSGHTGPPASTGTVRLVLADSLGTPGGMSPRGISFSPDGALYVCDRETRGVLRVNMGDGATVRFGGFDARNGGRFSPDDVDASGGVDVFVLDGANSRVFRLDRGLRNATVISESSSGGRGRFGVFRGIAYDHSSGDVFVTNGTDGAVERIDLLSGITRVLGGFGNERMSLRSPAGIAVSDGNTLLVADEGRGAVAVLSRSGGEIRFIGTSALDAPRDVAAIPGGLLAVADRRGVAIMDRNGIVAGSAGYGADREMQPASVAWRDGSLFIADALSGMILVYAMEHRQ